MTTAFFAGSFDPFTTGHADIVRRGLSLFDGIIIAIGTNSSKTPWQPVEERLARLRELYKDEPRVRIETYDGLTVDAAKRLGANVILRGVRNAIDLEYERSIAQGNLDLEGMETVFLLASPTLAHVSSSLVRELSHYGRDVSIYLP